MYPKAYKQNFVRNGTVVSEKSKFLYVNDLAPRSRNDIDLQFSNTFINSIGCMHLPAFRLQAAIVSENSIVFTFSYRKSLIKLLNLTFLQNRSRSTYGRHYNKL